MEIKSTDLVSLFEKELLHGPEKDLTQIGIVIQVGDNICNVHGLQNALYQELVEFEGGNKGIIFELNESYVSIFLLYTSIPVLELETVHRTGQIFKISVSSDMLGRVVNALGNPIDALGELKI